MQSNRQHGRASWLMATGAALLASACMSRSTTGVATANASPVRMTARPAGERIVVRDAFTLPLRDACSYRASVDGRLVSSRTVAANDALSGSVRVRGFVTCPGGLQRTVRRQVTVDAMQADSLAQQIAEAGQITLDRSEGRCSYRPQIEWLPQGRFVARDVVERCIPWPDATRLTSVQVYPVDEQSSQWVANCRYDVRVFGVLRTRRASVSNPSAALYDATLRVRPELTCPGSDDLSLPERHIDRLGLTAHEVGTLISHAATARADHDGRVCAFVPQVRALGGQIEIASIEQRCGTSARGGGPATQTDQHSLEP